MSSRQGGYSGAKSVSTLRFCTKSGEGMEPGMLVKNIWRPDLPTDEFMVFEVVASEGFNHYTTG